MLLLTTLLSSAFAKDLDGRIAVGLNQSVGEIPSLSARFAIPLSQKALEVQVGAIVGFDTDPSNISPGFVFGLRGFYGLIVEDNMNILAGGCIAYISDNGSPTVRLQPSLESQVFLMGLDNLSLAPSIGLNIDFGNGNTKFSVGGSFMGSVHYWF